MNLNELRELIRDYTHGCSQAEVNKRLQEGKFEKEGLLEMLCHKDPTRSMAMHGMNKIMPISKDENVPTFSLNLFEKALLGLFALQAMCWLFFEKNWYYVVEYTAVAFFLLASKYLAVYLDKKAEQQVEMAEKNKPKTEYVIMREGKKVKVEESELVVGDIIYLKAGIRIPVDGILLDGNSLTVNEAAMLGQPQYAIKRPFDKIKDENACTLLLSHTNIINGCGWMIAVSIGEKTSGYAKQ